MNLDINENCEIIITNSTSNFSNNLDELKNSIEINFKNNYSNYYYQCGIANLYSENKFHCFGTNYYYQMKGEYKFDYIISIGTENNIQSTFKKNELTYYGLDFIYPNYHCDFYVSEEGSKIIFYYYSYNKDDRLLTNIYPNLNTTTKLLNCHRIILQDRNYDLTYCRLYEYELHYFENTYNNSKYYLAYNILCGKKESIQSIIHILDKTKYPVFRVKNFIIPYEFHIRNNSLFSLIVDIEGTISNYQSEENGFKVVAFAEKISGGNETIFLDCYTGKPSFITKNYTINCYMYCGENYIIYYNDIYLGPYSYPLKVIEPFEVIISNFLKVKMPK